MNLKHLTDSTLLKDTKKLAQKEREITAEVLHHIKEIDARKLYSDLKYSSLFEYCIKELSYSESAAYRRIEASKILKDIPQIEEKIEQGSLSLSNIAKAAQFFKEESISDIKDKKEILIQVENLSARECDKKLGLMKKNEDKRIRITLKEKTHSELLQLRSLAGKYLSLDDFIQLMIDHEKAKIEKDKFKQNSSVRLTPTSQAGRVISNGIKRQVYLRDKKCVQCGTKGCLNFDHRKPYALGGKSTLENVRLLCFNCNQRSRIKAKL